MQFSPRKRHPDCPKLILHYDDVYKGCNVQQYAGKPLVRQYLDSAIATIDQAVKDPRYTRIFAFRVDLRYPNAMPWLSLHDNSKVMKHFLAHVNYELQAANTKYNTPMRYIWAREQNNSELPHYHVMFLLNYDAFNRIGDMHPDPNGRYTKNNLYHRVVRAWANAIGWPQEEAGGLVHVCRSPDGGYGQCAHHEDVDAIREIFYTASYLCKAHTKPIGQQIHTFSTSRI